MKLFFKEKLYEIESLTAECNFVSVKNSEKSYYTLVNEYDPLNAKTVYNKNIPMFFSYENEKGFLCKPVTKAYENKKLIDLDKINLQKIIGFAVTICQYNGNVEIKLKDEKLSSLKIKTQFEINKSSRIIFLIKDGVLSIKNIDELVSTQTEIYRPHLKFELKFRI